MRQNLARLPKDDLVRALRDAPNLNGSDLNHVDLSRVNLASSNLSGGRFHGANLSGSYLQGVIARHTSFIGARMSGVILAAAMLEGAGFRSADLRLANLRWADLEGSNMAGADLSGAQLFEAKMTDVVLTEANMEGAQLESVELDGAVLRDVRLAGAVLHSAALRNADMYGADLRRCDLRGADLGGANLLSAQLEGAVYDDSTVFPAGLDTADRGLCFLGPDAELPRADLSGFEFRGEDLSGADLTRAKLLGADLRGADLGGADLRGADLGGADLRGADLGGADLTGARLRGALYDDCTQFPEGFDPEARGAYAVVPRTVIRAAKMQWKRLTNAALSGAQLEGADLTGADLTGAQLNSANLAGAVLYCANLTGAGLHGVILRRVNARGSILQNADLRRADLRGADFSWADFAEADLRGAELAGACLTDARLRGARYDEHTAFPVGFDPAMARMMGGDVEAAGSRPEASHTAADVGADLRGLSIRNIRRSVETACASWIQRRGREMLGQVALCCASVGVFAVIAWQAMGIHEAPSRAPHTPAKVTQALDTGPASDRRVLELTIIAGAGPIAVDPDPFYAPAARRVDAVALSAPASAVVATPATPRVAQDTTIIAAAPAASPTSPLVAPVVVLDDPVDAPPPVVAVAPAPSIVEIAPAQVVAAVPLDDQELVVASASPGILAAVDQWRSVWEAQDTAAYVDLYHLENPVARANASGRLIQFTKARLSARAQNVFDTYDRIQVSIGRLDVSHEGDLVVSTFDEDFVAWRADAGASPDYVGRGRKTLVYARDTDNAWRIVSEQWRPAQH